jgi:hypothetical protein
LRQAHDRGREVHVGTVNDPRQMLRLMQRGVGNIVAEKDLVYVIRTAVGQETLKPAEFARRFGWKNDPSRVAAMP